VFSAVSRELKQVNTEIKQNLLEKIWPKLWMIHRWPDLQRSINDQEIISILNSREYDNDTESYVNDADLSINSVPRAAWIVSNYLAIYNISSKTNFEKAEKKIQYDF